MVDALRCGRDVAGKLHGLHESLCADQHYLARMSVQDAHSAPQWEEDAILPK